MQTTTLSILSIIIIVTIAIFIIVKSKRTPSYEVSRDKNAIIKKIAFYVDKKQKADTPFEVEQCNKLIDYWQKEFRKL